MYVMESNAEASRLEKKTDPGETEKQLRLAGIAPGMRTLDAGAGTGAVARVMGRLVGSNGAVTAMDASGDRLNYGKMIAEKEGPKNIKFTIGNIMSPPFPVESFDFIWCRFVFEYLSRPDAAMNSLLDLLAHGGTLVIGDLDGNGVFHDGIDPETEKTLHQVINGFKDSFDPYAGRKLYQRFFRRRLRDIKVHCLPYHLYAGSIPENHLDNWKGKFETIRAHAVSELGSVERYDHFVENFLNFLKSPDTFTYSILFLVTGKKE